MSKIWTDQEIINLIETNDLAVTRAVIAIYQRQTEDEKSIEGTHYHNGIGFNSVDAKYMTYLAKYCQDNRRLTGEHLQKARKKIKKYHRQLLEIANGGQGETKKHRSKIC